MAKRFGDRMEQFALSVDVMDDVTFEDLLKLIEGYVRDELDIRFFALLEEQAIDDGRGLRTFWSTREERPSYTLRADNDTYAGQTAYAFGENQPLWVVSRERKALQETEDYEDLWSGSNPLPRYSSRVTEAVRTSITMPLSLRGIPFGVVEFATERYIEPTPAARQELSKLAGVLSRTYRMREASNAQRVSTRKALRMLQNARKNESWSNLALPKLFVAYPDRADAEVVETLQSVLKNYDAKVRIVDWREISEPGSVNEQVIREISGAEFGLCYFSECCEEGAELPFRDNPNVIFEAGMMQALRNSPDATLEAWLAIREEKCDELPFDFASERILLVDRTADGSLAGTDFADKLNKVMLSMIEGADAATSSD